MEVKRVPVGPHYVTATWDRRRPFAGWLQYALLYLDVSFTRRHRGDYGWILVSDDSLGRIMA